MYYTCAAENTGAEIQLSDGVQGIQTTIHEAHDPPLLGSENDRFERIESYVKDFKPVSLGTIKLDKGEQTLSLRAVEIPGSAAIDFRMLVFKKL